MRRRSAGPDQRHPVVRSLFALIAVGLIGTIGFVLIEGWPIHRAFYFTIITLTTVGYSDEGASESGRLFAAFLLIGGLGVVSYSFAQLVQSAVQNGLTWRNRMQGKVDKLTDHVIVCGYGKMGSTVCAELAANDAGLVVVDVEPSRIEAAIADGYHAVQGNATDDEILRRAGIDRADHIVAVMSNEAENIVVTLSARELRPDVLIIARSESHEDARKLRRAGADRIVSPYQSGGYDVANAVLHPHLAEVVSRSASGRSEVVLGAVEVEAGSRLSGCSLGDYGSTVATRTSFVLLERPGQDPVSSPRGSTRMEPGDLIVIAGPPPEVVQMSAHATGPIHEDFEVDASVPV